MDNRELAYTLARALQLKRWHVLKQLRKKSEFLYHGQLPVIEFLLENPGITQSEVAERFALSKAAVTKSMKRMINSGVITRCNNENDERRYRLFVTSKGERLAKENREIFNSVDELAFKDFSEEEFNQLCSFIKRINNNLEDEYSRGKSPGVIYEEIKKMESEE